MSGVGVTRPLLRRALLLAAICYAPMLALHALCITGVAGWRLYGVELLMLPPIGALAVVFVAAPASLVPRFRLAALRLTVTSATIALLAVPAALASAALRSFGFALAAERAAPLIAAIERYRADHGAPPPRLDALVPRHLAALPAGLPPLTIETGDEAARLYHGNEWVLRAAVGTGAFNWDLFLYFPNGAYPERGYGGWLERIGAWAYVHE